MTLAEVADELDNLAQTYAESGQFPAVTFADHVREQAAVARTADADLRACRERAAALEAVAAALLAALPSVLRAHWYKSVETTAQLQTCWCGWHRSAQVPVISSGEAWIAHILDVLAARAAGGSQ